MVLSEVDTMTAIQERLWIIACGLASFATASTQAANITAGMHTLLPNTPGQQLQILTTGGEGVSGIDFFVQIGDGGPTVGGDDTGPTITNLDLVAGTIFAANNSGIFTDPAPLIWGATTTTTSGTVPADGLVATLTIDTTGLSTGQFDLILNPPATGPTAFADSSVTTSLTNGWLRIGAAPMTLGDYNKNSTVDAVDYVVWRDSLDQMGSDLAADGNANNQIDPGDYEVWRTHFGNAIVGAASQAVHEAVKTGRQGDGETRRFNTGLRSQFPLSPGFLVSMSDGPPRLGGPTSVPEPQSQLLLLSAVLTPSAIPRGPRRRAGRPS
jgi:hypothetical protein